MLSLLFSVVLCDISVRAVCHIYVHAVCHVYLILLSISTAGHPRSHVLAMVNSPIDLYSTLLLWGKVNNLNILDICVRANSPTFQLWLMIRTRTRKEKLTRMNAL